MPRARVYGLFAIMIAIILGALFLYYAFISKNISILGSFKNINPNSFYAVSIPIGLVTLGLLGTGAWIGWTILTIKVVPPMPDIVERKDYAKVKAFFLCILALTLAGLFIYGLYIKSYLALAIPSAVITLVLLGMIFWVGIAIITTRKTLPENSE